MEASLGRVSAYKKTTPVAKTKGYLVPPPLFLPQVVRRGGWPVLIAGSLTEPENDGADETDDGQHVVVDEETAPRATVSFSTAD